MQTVRQTPSRKSSPLRHLLIPGVLAVALGAAALPGLAQDLLAPPPPGPTIGEQGPGLRHFHHEGPHRGPFMHELRELGLSETQKASVKGVFEASRGSARAEHEQLHSVRRAYETLTPGSAGYATAVARLQDAEANAARARVQREADLKTQVFALLTDAQKATLTTKLANLPEPPAPPAPL